VKNFALRNWLRYGAFPTPSITIAESNARYQQRELGRITTATGNRTLILNARINFRGRPRNASATAVKAYCFAYTRTLSTGLLSGPTPLWVTVLVFPSREISHFSVTSFFPLR